MNRLLFFTPIRFSRSIFFFQKYLRILKYKTYFGLYIKKTISLHINFCEYIKHDPHNTTDPAHILQAFLVSYEPSTI